MYEDMDDSDAQRLAAMQSMSADDLQKSLADGSFRALARVRRQSGRWRRRAVVITPWPAHPYDLECRRATILNVYTDPRYRRQGIARQIMQTMIDWCKREGFARIYLHASNDGRHLYETLGFKPGNEMKRKLP